MGQKIARQMFLVEILKMSKQCSDNFEILSIVSTSKCNLDGLKQS